MQEPPLAVQPPASPQPQSKGLAITSMVLGIISVTCLGLILGGMIYRAAGMMLGIISVGCLGPISGVLAVITGGNAYNRRLKAPEQYGGAGFAIAGFVMGGGAQAPFRCCCCRTCSRASGDDSAGAQAALLRCCCCSPVVGWGLRVLQGTESSFLRCSFWPGRLVPS